MKKTKRYSKRMNEFWGRRLREIRVRRGFSQSDLARAAKISNEYVGKIERAEVNNIGTETVEGLARALGLHPAYLLYGETATTEEAKPAGKPDLPDRVPLKSPKAWPPKYTSIRLLPVLGSANCGKWKDMTDLTFPASLAEEFIPAPSKDENAFIVKVEGDSMIFDRIKEGDYLVIEPGAPIRNGDIVLAWDPNLGCTVKKFYRRKNGTIILIAANPKYEPIEIKPNENFRCYRVKRRIEEL